jgi:hypothetical protein
MGVERLLAHPLYSCDLPSTPLAGWCDVTYGLNNDTPIIYYALLNVIYFLVYTWNDGQSPNRDKKVKSALFTP